MGLTAPVLMAIVAFYWLAGCFTIIAWLKAISNLCIGNFIRAALWLNLEIFMLFWWTDKPHDWDTMMPGIVFFTCLGALGTFLRYRSKRNAMLAVPASTPSFDAPGNIAPIIVVEYRRLSD
jgi:hypothetical protein